MAALALPSVLAERTIPPDTLVIVKTSLNFGGKVERHLPPHELQRMGMHLARHVTGPATYKFLRAADVPSQWWTTPRFASNVSSRTTRAREHRAIVWRDRLVLIEGINRFAIKKLVSNIESRSFYCTLVDGRYRASTDARPRVERVLAQLAVFVATFGLEFGAIDVVAGNSGDQYIIDVNTTPYLLVKAADVLEHIGGALPRD